LAEAGPFPEALRKNKDRYVIASAPDPAARPEQIQQCAAPSWHFARRWRGTMSSIK